MAREAISLYKNNKTYQAFQRNCLKWAKSLNWEDATKESLRLIETLNENE